MDLRNLIKWSVILAAIVAWKNMEAMDLPEDVYRDNYQQTEQLPDHFAYQYLLKDLQHTVDRGGRDQAVARISEKMAFNTVDSEMFLDYLLTAHASLTVANQRITNGLLCKPSRRPRGPEALATMDTIDDAKESNSRDHFAHASVTAGDEHAAQLSDWLAEVKTEASLQRFNHARLYDALDMNVDAVVAVACNHLASLNQ